MLLQMYNTKAVAYKKVVWHKW